MGDWVYFAGVYDTKFEAYCAVMWVEADERIRRSARPTQVEVYRLRNGKYGVRFLPQERQLAQRAQAE
ncbi:hypothetical protein [Alicyclobacillus fructus]|uniref:hypothetical protein n=1 Tax=Alicyclobacillus fructus TaxID=2816082 RepID=UPI001A8DAD8A|nr:hypothetical protein [Alicyclobacillus fructus]